MKLSSLLLTVICVLGISIGQILFKKAASVVNPGQGVLNIFLNGWLIVAVILYGLTTLLWVYILRGVPLTIAYPFMGLAFIFVPAISAFFLNEPLKWQSIVGGGFILIGVAIAARSEG